MGKITKSLLDSWIQRLREEGFLDLIDDASDDGAQATHLEGFIRAVSLGEGFDDRQTNRLRVLTNELIELCAVFNRPSVRLFFDADVLAQCLHGLYGPSMATAMIADRRQRRILIEGPHIYDTDQLARLLLDTLSIATGSAVYHATWSSAYSQQQLKINEPSKRVGERAYDQQRTAKYWRLSDPQELGVEPRSILLNGFPSALRNGLGSAHVLVTTSAPGVAPIEDQSFRQVVGAHAVVKLKSLNEVLSRGAPVLPFIESEAELLFSEVISPDVLRQLSARLEGYTWTKGRQTLASLLCMLDARGLLVHFDDQALERTISDLDDSSDAHQEQSVHDGLGGHLADGFLRGQTLPELLYQFEREAYVYAARVCAVKRPGENIRVQDLSLVLKTPRQTVSRKWHAFQITANEYLLKP
jgi:hypothetical protein